MLCAAPQCADRCLWIPSSTHVSDMPLDTVLDSRLGHTSGYRPRLASRTYLWIPSSTRVSDIKHELIDGYLPMIALRKMNTLHALAQTVLVVLACLGASLAQADDRDVNSGAVLRDKYRGLQDQLGHNQFQRPLYMESREATGQVAGDIYALVSYPFATVDAALSGAAHWCDILLLHLNTKYCRAAADGRGSALQVYIGKKHEQPLDEAYRVDFVYRIAAETPTYLKLLLTADEGPLSTRDYRIIVESIPVDDGSTFIHFTYSYAYGFAGQLALQAYLGTLGSGKVGFTVKGRQADGVPIYVGGIRGLVERNTMRYYLAIEAYLGALSAPPQARQEKSLHDWFAAIERYPRQLHELEQGEYLDMKRKEYVRARVESRSP